MLVGYSLSFVFLLLLAAGIYLFGYAARRASPLYVTALEILLGIFVVTPIVLWADGLSVTEMFTKPSGHHWMWLGLSGVAGFLGGNFFSVINLKTAGERTNSLLSPAITACAVAAGVLVFAEVITLQKGVGIVITLVAVSFFLLSKTGSATRVGRPNAAAWSGAATIACITAGIVCAIKGTLQSELSIMHSVWLRLFVVLPVALGIFSFQLKRATRLPARVYVAIGLGVVLQTVVAAYLWFYCTYKVGISTFQILIATLPFFVYAADVYLFKRTKPSPYFLTTAVIAVAGIWLVMA